MVDVLNNVCLLETSFTYNVETMVQTGSTCGKRDVNAIKITV